MGNGIRLTEEEYAAIVARLNRPAVRAADAKPARRAVTAPADEVKEIHSRYRIAIHHRTRRLADATGRSHKAAVDGIVRGGLLPDDSPKYHEATTETFEKADYDETRIDLIEEG